MQHLCLVTMMFVLYINHTTPVNHEIGAWYPIEAYQLVESYEKGELKGELKEIVSFDRLLT